MSCGGVQACMQACVQACARLCSRHCGRGGEQAGVPGPAADLPAGRATGQNRCRTRHFRHGFLPFLVRILTFSSVFFLCSFSFRERGGGCHGTSVRFVDVRCTPDTAQSTWPWHAPLCRGFLLATSSHGVKPRGPCTRRQCGKDACRWGTPPAVMLGDPFQPFVFCGGSCGRRAGSECAPRLIHQRSGWFPSRREGPPCTW